MDYLKYFNLGLAVFSPAVVGLMIGVLLDRKFGLFPVMTVTMLFLGILSGLWSLYRSIKSIV